LCIIAPKVVEFEGGIIGIIQATSAYFFYVFLLMLIDKEKSLSILKNVIYSSVTILILNLALLSSVFYSGLNHIYNKTYTIANQIVNQVTLRYGYNTEMQLLIIGAFERGNYTDSVVMEEIYQNILRGTIASNRLFWNDEHDFYPNEYGWITFINEHLGMNYRIVDSDIEEVINKYGLDEMEIFPQEGSIRKIDDIIAVKLSYN